MEEKRKHLKRIWEQLLNGKKNYDKVLVRFPKGTKEKITKTGSSLNGFIVSAVNEKLEHEN